MDPNNPDPIYIEEGMICPNCGKGSMQAPVVVNCSCHISAPCPAHSEANLKCDVCGWKEGDAMDPPDRAGDALEEIKAILKKYDCAGFVIVADQKHAHFRYEFEPSWSCVWIEHKDGAEIVRVKSKAEDYPDKDTQARVIADSIGMLQGFYDVIANTMENLGNLIGMIAEKVQFSHSTRFTNKPDGPN